VVRPKALEFEWDPVKAAANRRKHGVSFEEAMSAFLDPFGIYFPASRRSEQRFCLLAMSARERVLFTVHAERDEDVVRIISARLATRRERRRYEEGR
jgi:uncharacterized DUF497 family protein